MAETEQLLLGTLSSSGPNVIKNTWVIQEVETPEYVGDNPPPLGPTGKILAHLKTVQYKYYHLKGIFYRMDARRCTYYNSAAGRTFG